MAVIAAERRAPAGRLARFWASTVGKKIVMAVTGLIMAGFLVMHMSANLLAFSGAIVGSFLNVCIHRLPQGGSVVAPRSRCPACGNPIRAWDNIPLVSFVLLRGRCRDCGQPISWRYPLVEGLTGLLFALTVARYGLTALAASLLFLVSGLVVVAFVDLDHQVIPNVITLPGIPLGLLVALAVGGPPLLERIVGALTGAGFLYLVLLYGSALYGQDAMGEGDLNLIALVGAFLGWRAFVPRRGSRPHPTRSV